MLKCHAKAWLACEYKASYTSKRFCCSSWHTRYSQAIYSFSDYCRFQCFIFCHLALHGSYNVGIFDFWESWQEEYAQRIRKRNSRSDWAVPEIIVLFQSFATFQRNFTRMLWSLTIVVQRIFPGTYYGKTNTGMSKVFLYTEWFELYTKTINLWTTC